MPELPEVETTRRGIAPAIVGKSVTDVVIRDSRLRWPIPSELHPLLSGQRCVSVDRRGKYLLLNFANGALLLHLGMSGSLRTVLPTTPILKHDHFDLVFDHNLALRLRDPRRFGAVLWAGKNPTEHVLLAKLGPEPLTTDFNPDRLFQLARGRTAAVKTFIMDNATVVGVGNIYANESLFMANIKPTRAAGKLTRGDCERLYAAIVKILAAAIEQGGTTLRDFAAADGQPGYFAQQLSVYGRAGEPCPQCGTLISTLRIGQRAAFYCGKCQR